MRWCAACLSPATSGHHGCCLVTGCLHGAARVGAGLAGLRCVPCPCGHAPEAHDFETLAHVPLGACRVRDCVCRAHGGWSWPRYAVTVPL